MREADRLCGSASSSRELTCSTCCCRDCSTAWNTKTHVHDDERVKLVWTHLLFLAAPQAVVSFSCHLASWMKLHPPLLHPPYDTEILNTGAWTVSIHSLYLSCFLQLIITTNSVFLPWESKMWLTFKTSWLIELSWLNYRQEAVTDMTFDFCEHCRHYFHYWSANSFTD